LVLVLAFAFSILAANAKAQNIPVEPNYDVKTMNFDMWCQEEVRLPVDRCDKRLPGDEKTFEAYRSQIERYEIPYLKEKSKEEQLDRNILHENPLTNPPPAQ
jgi:hypothetical protein